MKRRLVSLSFLAFTFLISGCVSNTKRIAEIDQSLRDPSALSALCKAEVSGACALTGAEAKGFRKLPILQGVTSAGQARFVVVAPKSKDLNYYVLGKGVPQKLQIEKFDFAAAGTVTHQFEVFDLLPKGSYEILVLGPDGQLWDRRKFRSLDLKKKNARLALVSCMDDSYEQVQKQIWPELLAKKPDAILSIGDNAYTDLISGIPRPVSDPQQIWERYAETRERLELFRADPLIPVIAVWDDHDYGKNDGDRTFALKGESTKIFFSFFPQTRPAPGFQRGPGVASWWSAFGVQIGLLDDRSFRSPDQVNAADQTHFGVEQERWLAEKIGAATEPLWLASGDQFFGGYHTFESFEGSHPSNFKAQLAQWKRIHATPIVFLSGDRHLSEILQVPAEHLGFATYEITSSGIHAKVFNDAFKRAPSPLQVAGQAGAYNYAILEIKEAQRKKLILNVISYGLGDKLLFQKELTVKP